MGNRVLHSDTSEHEKKPAVQHVQSVTARVKGKWLERRSDELGETASKDPLWAADAFCLNASITADELHDCMHLKRNKSPGIGGCAV